MIPKKVGCEPTPLMVQYTTLTTRPLRICWIDVKSFKYMYRQPQPKERT